MSVQLYRLCDQHGLVSLNGPFGLRLVRQTLWMGGVGVFGGDDVELVKMGLNCCGCGGDEIVGDCCYWLLLVGGNGCDG